MTQKGRPWYCGNRSMNPCRKLYVSWAVRLSPVGHLQGSERHAHTVACAHAAHRIGVNPVARRRGAQAGCQQLARTNGVVRGVVAEREPHASGALQEHHVGRAVPRPRVVVQRALGVGLEGTILGHEAATDGGATRAAVQPAGVSDARRGEVCGVRGRAGARASSAAGTHQSTGGGVALRHNARHSVTATQRSGSESVTGVCQRKQPSSARRCLTTRATLTKWVGCRVVGALLQPVEELAPVRGVNLPHQQRRGHRERGGGWKRQSRTLPHTAGHVWTTPPTHTHAENGKRSARMLFQHVHAP